MMSDTKNYFRLTKCCFFESSELSLIFIIAVFHLTVIDHNDDAVVIVIVQLLFMPPVHIALNVYS